MYADDIQIYASCKVSDMVSCINILNTELLSTNNWAKSNDLGINPNKSKCIIFFKKLFFSSLLYCCELLVNSDFETKRRMQQNNTICLWP